MAIRRILIDCTPISMTTPMTGIPRVVFNYIKWGYQFGFADKIAVVPVHVSSNGIFDARVILPDWMAEAPGSSQLGAGVRPREGERSSMLAAQKRRALEALVTSIGRPLSQTVEPPLSRFGLAGGIERTKLLYRRWQRLSNERLVNRYSLEICPGDLLFMPAYWHDQHPDIYRRAQMKGALIVPLVHDILPITRPNDYHSPWRDEFRAYVREILSFSNHVVCVSEATLKDVDTFMRSEGLSMPASSVRRHGVDRLQPAVQTTVALGVNQRLSAAMAAPNCNVLVVGSIEPKKNYMLLLGACERLWRNGHPFNLIVIGRKAWLSDTITDAFRRHPRLGRRLFWFDRATDADLDHAYRNCQLVLTPSKAEGFGLPLLEALAHRLPVLASDIPPFKEVGGTSIDYFDPGSVDSLENALGALLTNTLRMADLAGRASRFTWPTWEEAVFQSMNLLVSVGQKPPVINVTQN